MNQDEIIEMAKQAWKDSGEGWVDTAWFNGRAKALEAFAKLVDAKAFQNGYEKGIAAFNEAVLKEREACAKQVQSWNTAITDQIALAIRARGEQA